MKYSIIVTVAIISIVVLSNGCGSDSEFKKSPVDVLIRDMNDIPVFTIILYDMNVEGTFSKTYKHQYQIIKEKDGDPVEEITDWFEVSKSFFEQHTDDMGMEIASKKDGKVTKEASPPGYSNYVGNSQYGNWVTRSDGSSFWEFYGRYAFMSSMFNMMTYPVNRNYYNDYNTNYYGRRPYYGTTASGTSMYGTNSDYSSTARPNSTWSSNPKSNSFKSKVQSKVSRSSPSSSTSKTTRSSSRHNSSSSSSRSRSSGGFGK